jgi:hypothetical protein
MSVAESVPLIYLYERSVQPGSLTAILIATTTAGSFLDTEDTRRTAWTEQFEVDRRRAATQT